MKSFYFCGFYGCVNAGETLNFDPVEKLPRGSVFNDEMFNGIKI